MAWRTSSVLHSLVMSCKLLCERRAHKAHLRHHKRVADAKAGLQEQRSTDTLQLTVAQNSNAITQIVGLFHEMRCL